MNVSNSTNIQYKPSFKALLKPSDINCGQYNEFLKLHAHKITKTVLGERIAPKIPLKKITADFNVFFNLYGSGNLHLMLMPNTNGLHNFVKTIKNNKNSTFSNIKEMLNILKKTNPKEKLYLFESGASEQQSKNNSKGIIPAHLHFVLTNNFTNHKIFETFTNLSERKITYFNNIHVKDLFKDLSSITLNGRLGYKLLAKHVNKDYFNAWAIIENDPKIPSKSLLISKVFSQLINNDQNPQYYNWKIIDTDPNNWSSIMNRRIYTNRKNNNKFYDKLEKLKLINPNS